MNPFIDLGVIVVLEQIAYCADILAAVGVILSLIYVGRQLQQTNTVSRSTVLQSISGKLTDFLMSIASSPELAESIAKAQFSDFVRDNATDVEKIQIGYTYGAALWQIQHIYSQQKEGFLSQKEAEELLAPGSGLLDRPYLSSAWPILKVAMPPDFVEWFERRYAAYLGRQTSSVDD